MEEYEQVNGIYDRAKVESVYDLYKSGALDDKEACKIMEISIRQFEYYIRRYEEDLTQETLMMNITESVMVSRQS
jgi:hypothetical protein